MPHMQYLIQAWEHQGWTQQRAGRPAGGLTTDGQSLGTGRDAASYPHASSGGASARATRRHTLTTRS